MEYKYINYDKIINKITKKDSLFFGDYIIDPYQNCEFGCKYCDSTFEKIIFIKNDIINKVRKEIINIPRGTIIIGSVVDPYQNIEKNLEITRKLLKIIKNHQFNVHILTKSKLILRDVDILSQIKNAHVTISIISINKHVTNFFEKMVPHPLKRLELIKELSKNNIKTDLAIIPILPYIIENEIEDIIKLSLKYNVSFISYKLLELKGFQKKYFYDYLKIFNKELLKKYISLYNDNYIPNLEYINKINKNFSFYCKKYGVKNNF